MSENRLTGGSGDFHILSRRNLRIGFCLILLLFFSVTGPAMGQMTTGLDQRTLGETPSTYLNQMPPQGLERPVDPSIYQVVPGDIYALCLWGLVDTVLTVAVSPEGKMIIPSVGMIDLRGLTLEEASEKVAESVHQVLPSTETSLNLLQLGTFRVEITGLVSRPGGYPATGVQRVQDIINQAGKIFPGGSYRRVQISQNGWVNELDLVQWVLYGDINNNPTLTPGTRIHIPARGPSFRLRGPFSGGLEPLLSGRESTNPVDRLGSPPQISLEWKEGDTVNEAIHRAGGLTPEALHESVYLWRGTESEEGTRILEPVALINVESSRMLLHPGDLIDIPYREEWIAVTGAVYRPGRYSFIAGWTAEDYVNLAGGPSSVGKRTGWSLMREGKEKRFDAQEDLLAPGDILRVPETRTHKLTVLLSTASTAVALLISVVALSK
ncbi:MAG: SLBB domain-containing protein [Candidatus Eisenbacteria bacterium]|uniref:SLBB domain-containing protein n=1 Tax=Eiseniibacteriota bacterium TaxID=2212470 RepID=A0A948RU77_UNCEI|nr:SLBB domain-containing protein [Candidatus Eisenbacteria bacterium]MBU1949983.1 SLBB domain-containing protein [Candidatus Eisenbacteria bacterium]MBU2691100.1 SLBB domain-containing protein [Candidatus Eisenbacteria bacterium]